MHIQNLDKFYRWVLKILSGNEIMTDGRLNRQTEWQTIQIQYSPHFYQSGAIINVSSVYIRGLYKGFRDTGYLPFYFQGYRILSILLPGIWNTVFNIFLYFQGYQIFRKTNYGDICQYIRDTWLFTSRDMGYCYHPIQASYTVTIFRKCAQTTY